MILKYIFCWLILCGIYKCVYANSNDKEVPTWIVNIPTSWKFDSSLQSGFGKLTNRTDSNDTIFNFQRTCLNELLKQRNGTDYETVDALEHFFWGQQDGVSLELGALDGTEESESVTSIYEKKLGWKRILIEGNPCYKTSLPKLSPLAFSVNAAICRAETSVHYVTKPYIGGIVEYMHTPFMYQHWPEIIAATSMANKDDMITWNIENVNWSYPTLAPWVQDVACIPLHKIFETVIDILNIRHLHINYFVLDVEGGEADVLFSIDFDKVTFDILCIETKHRKKIDVLSSRALLSRKGYIKVSLSSFSLSLVLT